MTIGVLVTNYNSWPMALECIEAHLKLAGALIEQIVLVDDCSTEEYDGALDSRLTLVRNERNLGFVRSVNVGFRHLSTDIVVLFDADATPLMNYGPAVLRDFNADPELGIIGFTTYDKNNEVSGSSEREPGTASLILGQKLYSFYQRYVQAAAGDVVVYSCAMAVRRKAFDDVGGFDENFDWLDPDHDLCMSVRAKGWRVKCSPEIKAFHAGGGTPQRVSHRVLRFYANRWYLLRKHRKIRNAAFAREMILARLRMEYLILRLFGKWMFQDMQVFQDKLDGRRRIIRFCKENYE